MKKTVNFTNGFSRWALTLVVLVLLSSVALPSHSALAQTSSRVEVTSETSSPEEIHARLSRYFTPDIESGVYKYELATAYVVSYSSGGASIEMNLDDTRVILAFLVPVQIRTRSDPPADDQEVCEVYAAPVTTKQGENGIQWDFSEGCGVGRSIFHPLPDPA